MAFVRLALLLAVVASTTMANADEAPAPASPTCTSVAACREAASELAAAWRKKSDHPLIATAYQTSSLKGRHAGLDFPAPLIPLEQLFGLVADGRLWALDTPASVVLVGEQHDNGDHHAFQGALLSLLSAAWPRKPAAAFEQLNAGQRQGLAAFEDQAGTPESRTLDAFKRQVDWEHGGWAKYDYDPLLRATLDLGLKIYAADVSRDAIRKAAKEGPAALSADESHRYRLDVPLGAELDDASLSEIEASHCGAMPKSAFTGMAFAQRYRDANIADVVLTAAERHGAVVLFAGNGHVRSDRGVPWYLHNRAPERKAIALMVLEVEEGKADPEAYVPRGPDGQPAADYLIFTPRAERGDPCAGMRARKPG